MYLDGLLYALKSAGYDCFVGHVFTGAIAYADDLVRHMLRVCEAYAGDYDNVISMLVSPNVLCVVQRVVLSHADYKPLLSFISVAICIEVVDSWPHLGHIICKNSDDNRDILYRRSSFIYQANDMIRTFDKLDCAKTCNIISPCLWFIFL